MKRISSAMSCSCSTNSAQRAMEERACFPQAVYALLQRVDVDAERLSD